MSEMNSLENTAELNFKFQEASSELSILRSQYVSQSITIQKLEEELLLKQSSIESLKLAMSYNSNYEISKELDYKNRIEELEKNLKTTRQEKESLNTHLTRQISHKDSYIENLLTTMLNLHQKIEYYKEDICQAKKSLDNQKKTLEIESILREKAEKLYQESLEELEKYKKTFIEMKHKAVETDVDTEELFKNMKSEYEHEYVEETIKLAKNFEAKIKENSDNYNSRILLMEKTHKEVMENLSNYMQSRLENLRNHYEKRILSMIKEYSLQEAKVQSKIANLSSIISTFDDRYASLQGEVKGKTSALRIVTQERKALEQQKHDLDQYILTFQLENQVIIANIMAQLEQTKRQIETKQEDLKQEHEHNLKLLQQSKSIKVESIRTRYEKKLKKLSQNHEENSEKARKFHQDQCNFLLNELSKLEAEKTNLAIRLEHDVRELKKQLDLTIMECDTKLSVSRETILKDYEKEKNLIINEYKLRIHEQVKEFEVEKKKLEEIVENAYKKIIENVKKQGDKEKLEMFEDNLKKMEQVQNLCKKKCGHLENQLGIVKKSFYEEGEKWSQIVEHKENLIKNLEKTLEDRGLELDREKVKVLQVTQEKEELAKEYKQKMIDSLNNFYEKELELMHKLENDKKAAVAKVYSEKMEMEVKMEKTINSLSERAETLSHRYKMLEKKKKDIFLKENQQTIQRYVNEITDRNKTIDMLNKEIARLKIQIKYVGETVKIFTDDKISTGTHRKVVSDLTGNPSVRRPSSSGGNRTFKF